MSNPAHALNGLLNRYSVGIKYLTEPGPTQAQIDVLMAAAQRAPDHEQLRPWRMVLVRHQARERLADLFEAHARDKGKSEASIAMERERALAAPLTVAVVARIDHGHQKVPAHEQWITVGGAITNLLNAAHLMGFAAKTLSGDKVRAPAVVAAFCQPAEQLVAWVTIGSAATDRAVPNGALSAQALPQAAYQDWSN